MGEGFTPEMGLRLRQEARRAAAVEAERFAQDAGASEEAALLARLEQQLEQLSQAWAVHEKPLLSRLPLIGPLLTWVGSRLAGFLLQNQAGYNAQTATLLQELHRVQQLLAQKQIERSDDLFSRLDERALALEARIKDLEEEVTRLRVKP